MRSTARRLCTGAITAAVAALVLSVSSINAQTAAAVCKDGTTSASSGRGACSGHGGVNKSASKAAAKTVKREEKAAKAVAKKTAGTQVTTLCSDGTSSTAKGRGACSGHGGVKGAEVTSKVTGKAIPVPATAKPPKAAKVSTPVPRASPRAVTRANSNSAVAGNGSADDKNPKGAVAQCKDGMYSHAVNHQGACGHHGGVARWM
jgi:Protein of unknown function (DUF3761).